MSSKVSKPMNVAVTIVDKANKRLDAVLIFDGKTSARIWLDSAGATPVDANGHYKNRSYDYYLTPLIDMRSIEDI